MTLEIRRTSKWWYGRWMKDGKRHCACLDVEIFGKPGDKEFADSRLDAQKALDKVMGRAQEDKRPEDLVQEIHRVKFGRRIGSVELAGLFDAWLNIPRKRQPKEPYVDWAKRTVKRLVDFCKEEFPRVKEMAAVDKKVAEAFMRYEAARKVSPKTYNAELILLRGAFEHLREDAGMLNNPFGKIVTKDRETIHRRPFTREELTAVVAAAQADALMYPLVIVGACTAMRRGDACLLKWAAVDLKNRYITVKTAKTGETVDIPMFPMLRDVLQAHSTTKGKSPYVFPELAALYLRNPDGVNRRLGMVFERAGFMDTAELEDRKKNNLPVPAEHLGDVHVDREGGLQTANVRGFHSFRVTWITMALTAGVPMELVRRVTGHKGVDVVLKNYFKPGRDDFRQVVEGAMPKLLMSGNGQEEKTPKEKILEICAGMKAKTWKQDVEKIAALAAAM
jgi:integrase